MTTHPSACRERGADRTMRNPPLPHSLPLLVSFAALFGACGKSSTAARAPAPDVAPGPDSLEPQPDNTAPTPDIVPRRVAAVPAPPEPVADPARLVVTQGGSKCTLPTGASVDAELSACAAKGSDCRYVQQVTCQGFAPDEEQREREKRASDAGTVPCACVCADDYRRCAATP